MIKREKRHITRWHLNPQPLGLQAVNSTTVPRHLEPSNLHRFRPVNSSNRVSADLYFRARWPTELPTSNDGFEAPQRKFWSRKRRWRVSKNTLNATKKYLGKLFMLKAASSNLNVCFKSWPPAWRFFLSKLFKLHLSNVKQKHSQRLHSHVQWFWIY